MRQRSNQECRKKGKNSSKAAQKFTRRRNVRGARASSVLVSASCRNELKIRLSPRNARMNTKEKMAQHFRVWERTPPACWFWRLAETNLNPSWSAKDASETAVIFQFFGIGE